MEGFLLAPYFVSVLLLYCIRTCFMIDTTDNFHIACWSLGISIGGEEIWRMELFLQSKISNIPHEYEVGGYVFSICTSSLY